MKTINDLIKKYQLDIKNIRSDIAKLNREAETLCDVVMDLKELVQENEKEQVTDYVVKKGKG